MGGGADEAGWKHLQDNSQWRAGELRFDAGSLPKTAVDPEDLGVSEAAWIPADVDWRPPWVCCGVNGIDRETRVQVDRSFRQCKTEGLLDLCKKAE